MISASAGDVASPTEGAVDGSVESGAVLLGFAGGCGDDVGGKQPTNAMEASSIATMFRVVIKEMEFIASVSLLG
jgi:hypothetical protein